MLKIDGDHTRPATPLGQGRRELQHPQSADQVDLEGWPQRVAQEAHAVDFAAGLAQERVIHSGHQGLVLGQMGLDLLADVVEDRVLVETVLGIESVIRRPVQVMAVLSAQHGADRMAAKGDQLSQ